MKPFPLEVVDEVGSTNDVLKDRAANGDGEAALMARRQITGRGRSGRTWRSLDGNLHLSVLLRPDTLRYPGHFALMAAVALADATRPHLADPAALRLKWPNDLLLGGAKLAGILLEAGDTPHPWLVIGFGLNLRVAPADPARETTAIGKTAPPPELFALDVLKNLGTWRDRYRADGFSPIRAAWLRDGHRPGDHLDIRSGDHHTPGRFAGLTADGALLLDTDRGPVTITAGEVFGLPAPASTPA